MKSCMSCSVSTLSSIHEVTFSMPVKKSVLIWWAVRGIGVMCWCLSLFDVIAGLLVLWDSLTKRFWHIAMQPIMQLNLGSLWFSVCTCSLCNFARLTQTEVLMKVINMRFIHINSQLLLWTDLIFFLQKDAVPIQDQEIWHKVIKASQKDK